MTHQQLKLSIVIPSFNQARYIGETLASLVHQRDIQAEELEILLIDGGSTDGTMEVVQRYADRLAYVVSEPDRGQTHALIKGFERASGAIQGWLCSDDLLEPTAVREVLDYFRDHAHTRFIYGDAVWIDKNSRFIRHKKEIGFDWFIWTYYYNYIPQPSAFWRRELYAEVGGLDEKFDLAMDADLWARFAKRSVPVHIARSWSRVRTYADQKTQRLAGRSQAEDRLIRERLGARFGGPVRAQMLFNYAKGLRIVRKFAAGGYW
jgi:glycosyltransferase involved in cell wall biosynthesis